MTDDFDPVAMAMRNTAANARADVADSLLLAMKAALAQVVNERDELLVWKDNMTNLFNGLQAGADWMRKDRDALRAAAQRAVRAMVMMRLDHNDKEHRAALCIAEEALFTLLGGRDA